MSNAIHHRADVWTSGVALVAILSSKLGFVLLDPLAGIAVAAVIARGAVTTGWKAMLDLLDYSREDVAAKVQAALGDKLGDIQRVQTLNSKRLEIVIKAEPGTTVEQLSELEHRAGHIVDEAFGAGRYQVSVRAL